MNPVENSFYRTLLRIDSFCEYIPVIGTLIGLTGLVQRIFLFQRLASTSFERSEKERYFEHMRRKPSWRVAFSVLPPIGNLCIALHDLHCFYQERAEIEGRLKDLSLEQKELLQFYPEVFGAVASQKRKTRLLRKLQEGAEEDFFALFASLPTEQQEILLQTSDLFDPVASWVRDPLLQLFLALDGDECEIFLGALQSIRDSGITLEECALLWRPFYSFSQRHFLLQNYKQNLRSKKERELFTFLFGALSLSVQESLLEKSFRPNFSGLLFVCRSEVLASKERYQEVFSQQRAILDRAGDRLAAFFPERREKLLVQKLFELDDDRVIEKTIEELERNLSQRPDMSDAFYFDRLLLLLQVDFEQTPPSIPNDEELYRRHLEGVVVHEAQRDKKTLESWLSLKKRQGSLSLQKREEGVEAFLAYCASHIDRYKEKSLRALQGKERGFFGSLLGDQDSDCFTLLNFPVSSRELIGRLWFFAESYSREQRGFFVEQYCEASEETLEQYCARREQTELESVRLAMLRALAISYDEKERFVCNQGKMQRLCVAVLQGRLDGVAIDDEAQVSLDDLVNQFFSKTSVRDLYQKELLDTKERNRRDRDLLEAAALYYGEEQADSPVKKADFVAKIATTLDPFSAPYHLDKNL